MRRLSLLSGFAALALFASPVLAGEPQTGGMPLFNQNAGTIANVAAGHGNTATQNVWAQQHGPWGGGMVNSNLGTALNVAAGKHNTASQNIVAQQSGGPKGLVNSNLGFVGNFAIGKKNQAYQSVIGVQN